MNKKRTTRWDAPQYLDTNAAMVAYLEAALEDGDPGVIAAALGDIARAKGMTEVARKAGLGRESLYKALSPQGNPEFATVLRVIEALGMKLHAVPD
jgi:probable addiction module antidote protein